MNSPALKTRDIISLLVGFGDVTSLQVVYGQLEEYNPSTGTVLISSVSNDELLDALQTQPNFEENKEELQKAMQLRQMSVANPTVFYSHAIYKITKLKDEEERKN